MSKYMILLEGSVEDPAVLDALKGMSVEGFHIVVPAHAPTEVESHFLDVELALAEANEDPAVTMARWRLRAALDTLRDHPVAESVDGVVGPADPLHAVEDALQSDDFEKIVVITGRSGLAGRLHLDLASRIDRAFDKEVVHLEARTKVGPRS